VYNLQLQLESNETAVEGSWGAENSPFDQVNPDFATNLIPCESFVSMIKCCIFFSKSSA
jgi:hypothetical protein